MTVQTRHKIDSEELISRFEKLPERDRGKMLGYLERLEEASREEKSYDEYFNPQNVAILKESIADLKAGKGIVKTMAELEAMEDE